MQSQEVNTKSYWTHYCCGQLGPIPLETLGHPVGPTGVIPPEGWELVHFKSQSFQSASTPSPLPHLPWQLKEASGRVTDTCSRKSQACEEYEQENSVSDRNHKIRQNLNIQRRANPRKHFSYYGYFFYSPTKWFVNFLLKLQKRRSC